MAESRAVAKEALGDVSAMEAELRAAAANSDAPALQRSAIPLLRAYERLREKGMDEKAASTLERAILSVRRSAASHQRAEERKVKRNAKASRRAGKKAAGAASRAPREPVRDGPQPTAAEDVHVAAAPALADGADKSTGADAAAAAEGGSEKQDSGADIDLATAPEAPSASGYEAYTAVGDTVGAERSAYGPYAPYEAEAESEEGSTNAPDTGADPPPVERIHAADVADADTKDAAGAEAQAAAEREIMLGLPADINEAYQGILDRPVATATERLARDLEAVRMVRSVCEAAARAASGIVDERHTETKRRRFPSVDAGGVAGGEKYKVRSVFIKFVADQAGLYGTDEFAQKTAAHELRGLHGYERCSPEGKLRVPLFALVDYAGFRLACTSLLPLGAGSLVYGSADAARTVHTEDAETRDLMRRAGERLNLAPHRVGPSHAPSEIHSCVDIEGHRGRDGRHYVLDAARVFPAESPSGIQPASLLLAEAGAAPREVQLPMAPAALARAVRRLLGARPGQGVTSLGLPGANSGLAIAFLVPQGSSTADAAKAGASDGPRSLPDNERATTLAGDRIRGPALVLPRPMRAPHLTLLLRPEVCLAPAPTAAACGPNTPPWPISCSACGDQPCGAIQRCILLLWKD